jgi:predicted esterase
MKLILAILLITGSKGDVKKISEYIRKGMTAITEENYREGIKYFKLAFEMDTTQAPLAYNIACCYSLLNIKDSAIIWLRKTVNLGTYMFEKDPDFDNIRDMPEFKELAEKARKLLEEAEKKEWKPLVFLPENYNPSKKYPLFVALHGYGGSPENFTRRFHKFLTGKGYIFLAPYGTEVYGLKSFGWGNTEKCENKILEEIGEIKKKYSVDEKNIILLGYSQGGSRTFSIGLRNPDIFKGLIIVAGYFKEEEVKGYFENLKGKNLKVYVMVGEKDERVKESNIRAKGILEKYGVNVHLEIYKGVGHAFPGDPEKEVEKALKFIEGKRSK